jgi:hypothetical protein
MSPGYFQLKIYYTAFMSDMALHGICNLLQFLLIK